MGDGQFSHKKIYKLKWISLDNHTEDDIRFCWKFRRRRM
jgi:hypothetical protein